METTTTENSRETLAIMYTQQFFIALNMLEFCAREMVELRGINKQSKYRINLLKNFVKNWQGTQLDFEGRKTMDDMSTEHFMHLLEINLSLCLVHPEQLGWMVEQVNKLCLAAHNNQTLKSKK